MRLIAPLSRRRFLGALGCAIALGGISSGFGANWERPVNTKPVPGTGEPLAVIGMGTWITFNVGTDPLLRDERTEVLRTFFELGGELIDSSPMYGSAEAVLGYGLEKLGYPPDLFAATKVWTSSGAEGPSQVSESRRLWGVDRFDLLQVHNLVAWREHLETLFAMKEEGRVRYVGITTSHGRRHKDLEAIMRSQPIDFVQVTYNAVDREVESRILPLAVERNIAVIANRPYQGGSLINKVQRHPLPEWAAECGCRNWPELLLKYIVSHPVVTCVIPATTRVEHMRENMGAATGSLPDAAMRERISAYVRDL
ncbi:aldo/keto reductase [Thiohalomonas denitrificans]|uniref:Tat (Twin-arginine translocation) pathway signal sequence n=1 Tax=Thiohalomonas denitrificans TaxID=415747 RepID=A0A1G5QM72_9GAMM|nr:aldo/keto reductase [Thiohalomonas denitrificans]SCZ62746.1 Tat (twin-arginine translocation) pathway signal sequence [Thiohalomonas denitrificans]